MNPFKSLITEKTKDEKSKSSNDSFKKEKKDDEKSVFLEKIITPTYSNDGFNTPSEALGGIFNILVKLEKQKHNRFLEKIYQEKQQQNKIENRNKEIIRALNGGVITKKVKEKSIKTIKSKSLFLKAAIPLALTVAGTVAFADDFTTIPKPQGEADLKPASVPVASAEPVNEQPPSVTPKPEAETVPKETPKGEKENVFTGLIEPIKDDSEEKEAAKIKDSENKIREQQQREAADKAAADKAAADKAAADKAAAEEANRKRAEEEEANRKRAEEEANRKRAAADKAAAEEAAAEEANRKRAEEEEANRKRAAAEKAAADKAAAEEAAAEEANRKRAEEEEANRKRAAAEEANRNQTLEKISPATPIVPMKKPEPIISGPNPSVSQAINVPTMDGRKIYSIGDSHGEAVAVMNNKVTNMANGGQPSTSSTNYGGTWRGLSSSRRFGSPVGLANIPPNQNLIISQGANDTANSMRSHIDSKGKIPLIPPSKIASNVAKLVAAAQSNGHNVVFMLFPNGPGRGSGLAKYYGGDYQEEVRNAIRSAINVPIIDLNGRPLQPDGIHNTFPAYAAASKEAASKFDDSKTTKKVSSINNFPAVFDKNIFDLSNESMRLFSDIQNMENTDEIFESPIKLSSSNVNQREDMQENLKNDKPALISKNYEMTELIVG